MHVGSVTRWHSAVPGLDWTERSGRDSGRLSAAEPAPSRPVAGTVRASSPGGSRSPRGSSGSRRPRQQQPSAAVPRAGVMPRSLRSVIKANPGSPHSRAGTYYRPNLFMPPQRHRQDTGWWEGREGSHLPRLLSAWSSRSGNGVYVSGLPTHESRLRLPPSDPSPLCRKHPPTPHPQGAA